MHAYYRMRRNKYMLRSARSVPPISRSFGPKPGVEEFCVGRGGLMYCVGGTIAGLRNPEAEADFAAGELSPTCGEASVQLLGFEMPALIKAAATFCCCDISTLRAPTGGKERRITCGVESADPAGGFGAGVSELEICFGCTESADSVGCVRVRRNPKKRAARPVQNAMA